jgi:hypothetical protein
VAPTRQRKERGRRLLLARADWATRLLGRPMRQARDGAGRLNGPSATAEGNVLFLSFFFFSLFAYFQKYLK